jgi:hypothetical protein
MEPQPNRHLILQEETEEIEKLRAWFLIPIVSRIQILEQKVTKRTKRVTCAANGSSLSSFPFVKCRTDRFGGLKATERRS